MDLLRIVADQKLTQVERIRRGLSCGEHAPEPVSRADLVAQIEQFLPTPAQDAEIVAYCQGPYYFYAHQAVATRRRHGLNARRLEGGLPEWREDGRPLVMVSP